MHGCPLEEARHAGTGVVAHGRRHLALGLHLVVLLRLLRVALLSHLLRDTGCVRACLRSAGGLGMLLMHALAS